MRATSRVLTLGLLLAPLSAGLARPAFVSDALLGAAPASLGYLQCVPYARNTSGIRLFGDAHTWWSQAQGKYARGHIPKVGAVMAIRPFASSALGHVATVSRIVDARTILISHANWSTRGQIERNVTAIDVSPRNDWSQVRVWFAPIRNLGTTHWPVSGFIYNARPGAKPDQESKEAVAELKTAKPTKTEKRAARIDRRNDPIGAIISGVY